MNTQSPSFNQPAQTVTGPQTNVSQAHAPVLSGVFQGHVYIGSVESIQWEQVDYKDCLALTKQAFANHMRVFAGAEQDAQGRYMPLLFEQSESKVDLRGVGESTWTTGQHLVRTWDRLVEYPRTILLTGEPGSGKTTLLLHEASRLAELAEGDAAAPLPIYLPLKTFPGEAVDVLLGTAAQASKLEARVLSALWCQGRRSVCLFLDGADEVPEPQIKALVNTLEQLLRVSTTNHSLVVACRPGPLRDALKQSPLALTEIVALPLDESLVGSLLDRYDMADLQEYPGLRELLQTPDILSAIAQSLRSASLAVMPNNIGQIYQLYVDHHLFKNDRGKYDYWRVKRPVLARLAYMLLKQGRNYVVHNDELDRQLVQHLDDLAAQHARRRRIMPAVWTAADLVKELVDSSVLERNLAPDGSALLSFSKLGYRDYFAAVHLSQLGLNSPEVQELASAQVQEHCLQALIILASIQPEARVLYDRVYAPAPQLAADLWFENHPRSIEAPSIIRRAYEQQVESLKLAPVSRKGEPITTQLLVRMLNSRSPAKRLQAVRALSQWGLGGIEALLDAAQDDHMLVQATAVYALLHCGEPSHTLGHDVPAPLFGLEDREFTFFANGGCDAQVGPLYLTSTPTCIKTRVAVYIETMDFDPLAVKSAINLWNTPPAWFVEDWFRACQQVDWVGLAAWCDWIARCSAQVAGQAERAALSGLAAPLLHRAASYDSLCSFLTRDLGISRQGVPLEENTNAVRAENEKLFHQLRYVYSRANRSRLLKDQGGETFTSNQHIDQIQGNGHALGMGLEKVHIGPDIGQEGTPRTTVICNQHVEQMKDGLLTGVRIDDLYDAPDPVPQRLYIEGNIHVENSQHSIIQGINVKELCTQGGGFEAILNIHIEHFNESQLYGIIVQNTTLSPSIVKQLEGDQLF